MQERNSETADASFVRRLEEIAGTSSNRSAFAKAAGIPTSSLHNYLSGSEPTRPVLAALARAGNVSIDWLATGEGPKGRAPADYDNYVPIGFYDLTVTGNHIRAVLGNPTVRRLFPRDYIAGVVKNLIGNVRGIEGCAEGLSFEPEIRDRDVLVYDTDPDHAIARPTPVEAWPFEEGAIHLVAIGASLKLRKLRRGKKSKSVEAITDRGKVERLTGVPRDVILFGRVIWRGGALPPLYPAP